MSEVVAKRAGSTAAEDTLKQKSWEAGVVSPSSRCAVATSSYAPGTKNQTMYK
jgi:hypothetical protein